MTDKHSPTPWHKAEHSWEQTSIYDADNKFVATLTISDECDEDSQEEYESIMDSNAALIVEAVNTHAAHKEAVRELVEALQTCIDYMQSGDDGDSILDEMSDLIAKHSPEKVQS